MQKIGMLNKCWSQQNVVQNIIFIFNKLSENGVTFYECG